MDGMVSAVQVRKRLAEVIDRAAYGKERVILARRGKAVAAIVSLEDVELLEALEDRIDLENARAALIEGEKEGTVNPSPPGSKRLAGSGGLYRVRL